MPNKKIICFLTFRPSYEYYELCKEILEDNKYQGYICIDDNSYQIPNYDGRIPIIQIDNEECEMAGFLNTVTCCRNRACSRDKALYYFCKLEKKYRYIWFIEEDVFIPSKTTIPDLDDKYKTGDLVTSSHSIMENINFDWFFTKHTFEEFQYSIEPPYAKSLICAIRVSKKMMDLIEEYADFYNILPFCETLFNTLALKNDLEVVTPEELSTIVFRKDWEQKHINLHYLYHPIKEMEIQLKYRTLVRNIQLNKNRLNP